MRLQGWQARARSFFSMKLRQACRDANRHKHRLACAASCRQSARNPTPKHGHPALVTALGIARVLHGAYAVLSRLVSRKVKFFLGLVFTALGIAMVPHGAYVVLIRLVTRHVTFLNGLVLRCPLEL